MQTYAVSRPCLFAVRCAVSVDVNVRVRACGGVVQRREVASGNREADPACQHGTQHAAQGRGTHTVHEHTAIVLRAFLIE